MASLSDWHVAPALQPKPADYEFDLASALASMVALRTTIPSDAFTAETLGTERAGNGVLIRDGIVLTIGYLITEADAIWLHLSDGRTVPAHALGYDQETGFGLVQALARVDLPLLPIGESGAAQIGDRVWWAAPAARSARWRRASPTATSSPATGNTCWTRRSLPRRRILTGAARR